MASCNTKVGNQQHVLCSWMSLPFRSLHSLSVEMDSEYNRHSLICSLWVYALPLL